MSAEWVEMWGETDPDGWLASKLSLGGALTLVSTDRTVTLHDDRERRDHAVPVYELQEPSGRTIEAAMAELCNGVWVVAYKRPLR